MTTKQIIETITKELASYDERLLQEEIKWAFERKQAAREFRQSPEWQTMDLWKKYDELWSIAGGKTWYNAFKGRNDDMIIEFMTKNNKKRADARNAKIAKKLDKVGVTVVESADVVHGQNGFDGLFVVNTDNGHHSVKINTIYAGGYNIQCAHLRVLVKVSKKKG